MLESIVAEKKEKPLISIAIRKIIVRKDITIPTDLEIQSKTIL